MNIYRTIDEMRAAVKAARGAGRHRLGLVPTMGALHGGHLSLVRAARAECDWVAASIFVNPLQFGPTEDLARYPRPFERDRELLEAEQIDALFAPSAEEMYPGNEAAYVEVRDMSERLDGRSRPGHFRGVTTVVAKLFHIIPADRAYFGQKDAAQVAIIRRMARDLNFDVEIRVCPIVREADGVAMSSRNAYLNPEQRKAATALYRALARVQRARDLGEQNSAALLAAAKSVLAEEPLVKIDYVEIVHPETLEPLDHARGALIAVAAWVGETRLIDNLLLA
ncbi:MAG TPA: pantoate--beta-alanine ligase [Terriglobales bacterium]|nr:pantoate--beta-alanine ligase [Terriglobales bacterium]